MHFQCNCKYMLNFEWSDFQLLISKVRFKKGSKNNVWIILNESWNYDCEGKFLDVAGGSGIAINPSSQVWLVLDWSGGDSFACLRRYSAPKYRPVVDDVSQQMSLAWFLSRLLLFNFARYTELLANVQSTPVYVTIATSETSIVVTNQIDHISPWRRLCHLQLEINMFQLRGCKEISFSEGKSTW